MRFILYESKRDSSLKEKNRHGKANSLLWLVD
ncbi:hypothetical protein M918_07095 [Clostridium sp. BL8]|nr:hypothetical protein M918_07095 [Clostridium sp. BL8]